MHSCSSSKSMKILKNKTTHWVPLGTDYLSFNAHDPSPENTFYLRSLNLRPTLDEDLERGLDLHTKVMDGQACIRISDITRAFEGFLAIGDFSSSHATIRYFLSVYPSMAMDLHKSIVITILHSTLPTIKQTSLLILLRVLTTRLDIAMSTNSIKDVERVLTSLAAVICRFPKSKMVLLDSLELLLRSPPPYPDMLEDGSDWDWSSWIDIDSDIPDCISESCGTKIYNFGPVYHSTIKFLVTKRRDDLPSQLSIRDYNCRYFFDNSDTKVWSSTSGVAPTPIPLFERSTRSPKPGFAKTPYKECKRISFKDGLAAFAEHFCYAKACRDYKIKNPDDFVKVGQVHGKVWRNIRFLLCLLNDPMRNEPITVHLPEPKKHPLYSDLVVWYEDWKRAHCVIGETVSHERLDLGSVVMSKATRLGDNLFIDALKPNHVWYTKPISIVWATIFKLTEPHEHMARFHITTWLQLILSGHFDENNMCDLMLSICRFILEDCHSGTDDEKAKNEKHEETSTSLTTTESFKPRLRLSKSNGEGNNVALTLALSQSSPESFVGGWVDRIMDWCCVPDAVPRYLRRAPLASLINTSLSCPDGSMSPVKLSDWMFDMTSPMFLQSFLDREIEKPIGGPQLLYAPIPKEDIENPSETMVMEVQVQRGIQYIVDILFSSLSFEHKRRPDISLLDCIALCAMDMSRTSFHVGSMVAVQMDLVDDFAWHLSEKSSDFFAGRLVDIELVEKLEDIRESFYDTRTVFSEGIVPKDAVDLTPSSTFCDLEDELLVFSAFNQKEEKMRNLIAGCSYDPQSDKTPPRSKKIRPVDLEEQQALGIAGKIHEGVKDGEVVRYGAEPIEEEEEKRLQIQLDKIFKRDTEADNSDKSPNKKKRQMSLIHHPSPPSSNTRPANLKRRRKVAESFQYASVKDVTFDIKESKVFNIPTFRCRVFGPSEWKPFTGLSVSTSPTICFIDPSELFCETFLSIPSEDKLYWVWRVNLAWEDAIKSPEFDITVKVLMKLYPERETCTLFSVCTRRYVYLCADFDSFGLSKDQPYQVHASLIHGVISLTCKAPKSSLPVFSPNSFWWMIVPSVLGYVVDPEGIMWGSEPGYEDDPFVILPYKWRIQKRRIRNKSLTLERLFFIEGSTGSRRMVRTIQRWKKEILTAIQALYKWESVSKKHVQVFETKFCNLIRS